MSVIYRSIDVSTYIRIKPVSYEIETIDIEPPDTLHLKDINSKDSKSPFAYTSEGIFDSKTTTGQIFEKFRETQIESCLANRAGSLNYLLIGQNKCFKLTDIAGVCDRTTHQAEKGFFELLCDFVLKNELTFETRALKVESNKVTPLFCNTKETNFYIRVNTKHDITKAIKTLRGHLNFQNNNYNLILSIRMGKEKNKLINIVRLSMDESLQSTNRIQQIISLSDYYMLQRYIQELKSPVPNQSLIGFLDRSETLKQLEYSLLSIRGYGCVDSFNFIQYINPNKLNYDASIDGLLYLKGLKTDTSNRRADLETLKASNLDAIKKTDKEALSLQYELGEQVAQYNKLDKQVEKYLMTFERLSGLKISVEDILEHQGKILADIEQRHNADILYKDAENDTSIIMREAQEEEAEMKQLESLHDRDILELNKRGKKLLLDIQEVKSQYINISAENRRARELFHQNCATHMNEEGKRLNEELAPLVDVLNKILEFEADREAELQFRKDKERVMEKLRLKYKKQINSVLEGYADDAKRLDDKFIDKLEGLKVALNKLHKQFSDYNSDKETQLKNLDSEISTAKDFLNLIFNKKDGTKCCISWETIKQKLDRRLIAKKDLQLLSNAQLTVLNQHLNKSPSTTPSRQTLVLDNHTENQSKIDSLRAELQSIRKKNLEIEAKIHQKQTRLSSNTIKRY